MHQTSDKIEFLSKKDKPFLDDHVKPIRPKILPFGRLKLSSLDPEKQKPLYDAGYKTRSTITRLIEPDPFYDICIANKINLGIPHIIEQYADIVGLSESNCIKKVDQLGTQTIILYYSNRNHRFDRQRPESWIRKKASDFKSYSEYEDVLYNQYVNKIHKEKDKKRHKEKLKEIFGSTHYIGDPNYFQYVVYPRYAKWDLSIPVVHQEIRFVGDAIRDILDLKKGENFYFDGLKNLPNFTRISEKYLLRCKINMFNVARRDLGLSKVKKLTSKQSKKIELHAIGMKRAYKLYSSASCKDYFQKNSIRFEKFLDAI